MMAENVRCQDVCRGRPCWGFHHSDVRPLRWRWPLRQALQAAEVDACHEDMTGV